jgi:hypothetical protein
MRQTQQSQDSQSMEGSQMSFFKQSSHSTSPKHSRGTSGFNRDLLPSVQAYFEREGMSLKGYGVWRNALCPFHADSTPSLRVHIHSGGFRCMVCDARGGDVLALHMARFGLSFKVAAMQLGAWEVSK